MLAELEHPARRSDVDLLAQAAQHDRDAFLALYDRFAPRMLGLIVTIMRDRTAAEDVLQDVMLEVWNKHAARYNPVLGPVDAWMLRLARSRSIDALRAAGKRAAAPFDPLAHDAPDHADHSAPLAANEPLRRAMADVPEDERAPVMLAYLYGMSREDIAAHLNIPVGTVKTRIRRGLARLRESLQQTGASAS